MTTQVLGPAAQGSDEALAVTIGQIGLAAVIAWIMANESIYAVVAAMVQDGRQSLSLEEEAQLAAESEAIHRRHMAAIARAQEEGR